MSETYAYTFNAVQRRNFKSLRTALESSNIQNIDEYAKIIFKKEKVDSSSFPLLNAVALTRWKIPGEQALEIENFVKKNGPFTVAKRSNLPTKEEVFNLNSHNKLRSLLRLRLKGGEYKYIKIILKRVHNGSTFLLLCAKILEIWGIPGGPALKLENFVKEILGVVPTNVVENWREILASKKFDNKDINIIINQKVDGSSFLGLTAVTLERWGILGGPALKIEKLVNEIQFAKKSALLTVKKVLEWNLQHLQQLREFLKSNYIDDEVIKIITDKIKGNNGSEFLWMNSIALDKWGIDEITASKIETLIEEIQGPNFGEVSIVIDHSNLSKQGQKNDIIKESYHKKNWLNYKRLQSDILNERKLGGFSEIFYPTYNNIDKLWAKYNQDFNLRPIEQTTKHYKEKKLDTSLAIRGTEIFDRKPGILAIVAGDSDFIPLVEAALKRGWKVEIWFWSSALGLSEEYVELSKNFEKNYSIHKLDDIFKPVSRINQR
ncbi:1817_t:CDS:2 [Funneliformis geosporum]|uniref:1817_t:CDS:1 n=1 Tax=Funneliformis geosporum TaxID=1117311 RepID=A0A9W4WM53_9GLOM|nr:1817_t:CDS:2 [Funneliformis geosporum]